MVMAIESKMDKCDIFPFFELPRELRDRIYESCIADTQTCNIQSMDAECGATHHVRAEGLPCVNLLQISKKYSAEYQENIYTDMNMVVDEVGLKTVGHGRPQLPKVAEKIKNVTIRLELYRFDLLEDLDVSEQFVANFMPLLPTSTRPVVEIFVHHGERGRGSLVTLSDFQLLDEEGPAFALTKLEIATIKVYNIVSKEHHVYELKVLEETENFVMFELASWTTTSGWVELTESPSASE